MSNVVDFPGAVQEAPMAEWVEIDPIRQPQTIRVVLADPPVRSSAGTAISLIVAQMAVGLLVGFVVTMAVLS